MDVEHARTFLAVLETRNFVRAAERLFVTQSTVSTRIKTLEEQIGRQLFQRSKAGVTLTKAGTRFARHATAFLRIWGQARQEIALPEYHIARLTLGAQISHWDAVMMDWLCWLRERHPELAVRVEVGSNDSLMRQMSDGLLDLAVVYTPQSGSGFNVEKLFEEEIVLVGTRPPRQRATREPAALGMDYVYVDWGPEFRAEHALVWPDLNTPSVHFNVGTVALEFILRNGGSGFFPLRMVQQYVKNNVLHVQTGTPAFRRPTYLVTAAGPKEPFIEIVLTGLRRIAAETEALNLS